MGKLMLTVLIVLCIGFAGCSFLEKIMPSSTDESGLTVSGTHELSPTAQAVVGATGPYGQAAVGMFLLCWNFYERYRKNKAEKGLVATVKALKQAADDPATKEAFEKIKSYLANAHSIAEVSSMIDDILVKL